MKVGESFRDISEFVATGCRHAEALCIIVLICLGVVDVVHAGTGFIWFTTVSSLISTLVALCLYVVHLTETGPFVHVPWFLGEFILSSIWSLFFGISAIIAAVNSSRSSYYRNVLTSHGAYGAASFFCVLACLAFGACAYYFYRNWRFSTTVDGQRRTVTITTTTTTTPPRY
ncbi:hypothetical protein TTRE_0000230501 [Trichuris trichiura]|uniref:MARVEL domain-containing protein n=1 Tax=Trichuris trichiura TaxID=36087 RepID=A0A077Z1R6_TRITR|nr:hypothetical protein TTRE_0000230501 [Trichuris trichiura]